MRDKLIELLDEFYYTIASITRDDIENITRHLLENGVIVPPCKVGDTVYYLKRNYHTHMEKVTSGKVEGITITPNGICLYVDTHANKLPYGKRVFLTSEEAEQALKGGAE